MHLQITRILKENQRKKVKNDTIVSISTALSPSGIGIVRLSGDDAIEIAKKMFISKFNKDLSKVTSHTLTYGNIVDGDEVIDEALVSVMKGPNSFTAENVVEINSHGSILNLEIILELAIKKGARLAEPGEFTKRAFLNGRLDLTQAEAVMDIIDASTKMALKNSVKQLSGSLRKKVDEMNEKLMALIAHIEVSIDYPEYDAPELSYDLIRTSLLSVRDDVKAVIDSYADGKIYKEGIKTVIVGKPNVGKSTLLNSLAREERAIVTDIPGTTRDTLEVFLNVHGIPLKLIDTAGIRDTKDVVESIGVLKSKSAINDADLVLLILDSSDRIDEYDREIVNLIGDREVIILVNKVDLGTNISNDDLNYFNKFNIVEISAKEEIGIDKLKELIKSKFLKGNVAISNDIVITNLRQKDAFERCLESLDASLEATNNLVPIDLISIDIKDAITFLNEVIGENVKDNIVNEIFSRFCLGK